MKKITPRQYAVVLHEAIKEVGSNARSRALDNFLNLIFLNKDWKQLPKIIEIFGKICNQAEGIAEAKVESAAGLSGESEQKIKNWLKEKYHQDIAMETSVNPQLLAGFKLFYDDTILDASLENVLQNLKNNLNNQ